MKKQTYSLISIFIFVLALFGGLQPAAFGQTPTNLEKLPPHGSRILVIAPHCDDETLGAGILMHEAVKKGDQVKVVIVTNGDGYAFAVDRDFFTLHPTSKEFIRFGMQRQEESISALRELDVPSRNIVFLGFPDKGIAHLWTEFWDEDERFYSRYTGTSVNPYPNTFEFNAPYNGVTLLKDLNKIIDDYRPTDIYYPHPNDRHPDHWAVSAFTRYLLESKGFNTLRQHLYIIHHAKWPAPKLPLPFQPMTPPARLTNMGTIWRYFDFSPKEAELKALALLRYTTQVRVMKGFLLSFVRNSELFGSYPDYPMPRLSKANDGVPKRWETTSAIEDPIGNALTLNVDKSADIKKVLSYIDDNKWVIEVHTVGPVKPKIVYEIHARIFSEQNSVSRFDVQLEQGRAFWKAYASNSIIDLPNASVEVEHGYYRMIIPMQAMPKAKSVFLNVDTLMGRYMLDKTAWRMLRFPEPEEDKDTEAQKRSMEHH